LAHSVVYSAHVVCGGLGKRPSITPRSIISSITGTSLALCPKNSLNATNARSWQVELDGLGRVSFMKSEEAAKRTQRSGELVESCVEFYNK
jgi:hypothetical protein